MSARTSTKRDRTLLQVIYRSAFSFVFLIGFGGKAQAEITNQRWVSLGLGASFYLLTEVEKDQLSSGPCHWCEENAWDQKSRLSLRWQDPANADRLSNLSAFGLIPVGSFAALWALHGQWNYALVEDTVLVLESLIYSSDINQITKYAVRRERPFAHDQTPEQKVMGPKASDKNLSFYSGHTNMAFALAVSTGQILERHGQAAIYRYVLYSLASATAYWRVAADKHWTSDVFTGALLGGGFAWYWTEKKYPVKFTVLPNQVRLQYNW